MGTFTPTQKKIVIQYRKKSGEEYFEYCLYNESAELKVVGPKQWEKSPAEDMTSDHVLSKLLRYKLSKKHFGREQIPFNARLRRLGLDIDKHPHQCWALFEDI